MSSGAAFWKGRSAGGGDFGAAAVAAVTQWPLGFTSSSRLPGPGEDWPTGTHFVRVPSLQEMRRLVGPADDTIRRERSRHYFAGPHDRARARLRLGMHDRGEEYIFADGEIYAADAAGHIRHFPAHLKVVRLHDFHIGTDQIWDVTVSHTAWPGVDHREELYVYVHVDRLTVEPGASLEVHGNVLALQCGTIEMRHGQTSRGREAVRGFEIKILPTRHPANGRSRSSPGRTGVPGPDGADGADSTASTVIGTPFGPRLLESSPNCDGERGSDGRDGTDGTAGQNGGMTMLADIRIGDLIGFEPGSLHISAQAGAGLPGGGGGRGGNGGAGGNGADGVDGIDGLVCGGGGGRGGNGGHGGNGGRGGNGGLASNVFIRIPAAQIACLDLQAKDSAGGPGGGGGSGGAGARGGRPGALAGSEPAPGGARGRDGAPGTPGKSRIGAKMHVYADP